MGRWMDGQTDGGSDSNISPLYFHWGGGGKGYNDWEQWIFSKSIYTSKLHNNTHEQSIKTSNINYPYRLFTFCSLHLMTLLTAEWQLSNFSVLVQTQMPFAILTFPFVGEVINEFPSFPMSKHHMTTFTHHLTCIRQKEPRPVGQTLEEKTHFLIKSLTFIFYSSSWKTGVGTGCKWKSRLVWYFKIIPQYCDSIILFPFQIISQTFQCKIVDSVTLHTQLIQGMRWTGEKTGRNKVQVLTRLMT